MEGGSIVNELQQLQDSTDISSKTSYQSFLQQLNTPSYSTSDFYNHINQNLYHSATSSNSRDIGSVSSASSIQVYEKKPPPSYTESQSHHDILDDIGAKRFVEGFIDPAELQTPPDQHQHACKPDPGVDSVEFNDKLIWCDECRTSKPSDCPDHLPTVVSDKKLISRARQTLPSQFSIATTLDGQHSVVCSKRIKKWTRFGPLIGQKVTDISSPKDCMFKVFTSKENFSLLDMSDENVSNWLMFIRPALSAFDQNLVAYQHNGHIYFSSTTSIASGEELKVGYAESYAALMGVKALRQMVSATIPTFPEKKVLYKDGFPCDTCDLVFENFESLDAHSCPNEIIKTDAVNKGRRTRNRRKGKPQKLGSAPKTKITAGDKKGKLLHARKVAATRKYIKSKPEIMKCSKCELLFASGRRLDMHMYVHTGEYPYKCASTGCSKTFNSKFKVDRHRLTHGAREFTCVQCGKSFARKDNLQAHVVIHDSGRQMFQCTYNLCTKEYSSKMSFNAHIALHQVEEGSLECALCRKLFDNSDTITQHIKLHAGSYKTKGLMEKKYKCGTCDKRFFAPKDRDRHLLTHTKEKNFECNICLMRFSRSDHLKRHVAKIHPDGQKSVPRISRGRSTKAEQLADLSASEFTRSIQNLLAETGLVMEDPPVTSLSNTGELGVTTTAVQIAPMLNSITNNRSDTMNFTSSQTLVAGQRSSINGFLNHHHQIGAGKLSASTNWHQTAAAAGESTMRYVISGDPLPSNGDSNLPRYYITGDTIRLPPEGTITTAYLLPTDNSQASTVNLDAMHRPQSSLLMDSSHTLPSDSLSNDFTADGMKVLTGLAPIFLNPDGTTTDNDLMPIVYHSNQS